MTYNYYLNYPSTNKFADIVTWCNVHLGKDAIDDSVGKWTWGNEGTGGRYVFHLMDDAANLWFVLVWSAHVARSY